MHKVLIFDTSMLCVWLEIPGKETCGAGETAWTTAKIEQLIEQEISNGTTLVLPLASIIETGNHIAQASRLRHEKAIALAKLITQTADERSPWAAFSAQVVLWEPNALKQLVDEWVDLAPQKISLGDVAIKAVAEYYAKLCFSVEILTGDRGLKAFEPIPIPTIQKPRRRKS